MADTVSVDYLYPFNLLDSDWNNRAGTKRVVVRLTGTSDATGETDVVKVDLSDLKTHDGNAPSRTVVEWMEWRVHGMAVKLEWDRAPQSTIININDIGFNNATTETDFRDWTKFGGLADPGDDDRTGDILLTSSYGYSGDTYDIIMCLRLKD